MFARTVLIAVVMLPGSLAAEELIVPNRSVGVIHAGVTEASLLATLPEGQVRRQLRDLGEGYGVCSTEVYAGTLRAMLVDWANSVEYDMSMPSAEAECLSLPNRLEPAEVTIDLTEENALIWQTTEGIGVGMTVTDLAQLLGRPFDFSVCPCDYGGFISSVEEMPDGLSLRVGFPQNIDHTLAEFVDPEQDYLLSSNHIPLEMRSEFVVEQISVKIAP